MIYVFKQQFSVFKQYFMHFNAFFHPHVFSQIFLNNNFQFLNTHTKRVPCFSKKKKKTLKTMFLKKNLKKKTPKPCVLIFFLITKATSLIMICLTKPSLFLSKKKNDRVYTYSFYKFFFFFFLKRE